MIGGTIGAMTGVIAATTAGTDQSDKPDTLEGARRANTSRLFFIQPPLHG